MLATLKFNPIRLGSNEFSVRCRAIHSKGRLFGWLDGRKAGCATEISPCPLYLNNNGPSLGPWFVSRSNVLTLSVARSGDSDRLRLRIGAEEEDMLARDPTPRGGSQLPVEH